MTHAPRAHAREQKTVPNVNCLIFKKVTSYKWSGLPFGATEMLYEKNRQLFFEDTFIHILLYRTKKCKLSLGSSLHHVVSVFVLLEIKQKLVFRIDIVIFCMNTAYLATICILFTFMTGTCIHPPSTQSYKILWYIQMCYLQKLAVVLCFGSAE